MEFAARIAEVTMAEHEPAQPAPDRLSIPAASDIERHISGGVRHRATAPEPRDAEGGDDAPDHHGKETLTKAGKPGDNR